MAINSEALLVLCLLLLFFQSQSLHVTSAASSSAENSHFRPQRPPNRAFPRISPKYGKPHQDNIPDLLDDDDLFDFSKRQVIDDYGHLRFGKRGDDFDDYGHLRFGRSGEKK